MKVQNVIIFGLLFALLSPALAGGETCKKTVASALEEHGSTESPKLKKAFELVSNHELKIYDARLKMILERVKTKEITFAAALRWFYKKNYFPKDLIEPRLKMAEELTPENILSVLGDLSLEETVRLFVGKDPTIVEEDSLLGRYLAESGAKLQIRQFTHQKAAVFNPQPGGQQAQIQETPAETGPPRLLIPVDENSFPILLKYFSNIQTYSVQGHANMFFKGKLYPFAGKMQDARLFSLATALPMVLLKTSEGARLDRYMTTNDDYYSGTWGTSMKRPWQIKAADGTNYLSAAGQFNCCTHWHGNIPLGDKFVTEIILPGPKDKSVTAEIKTPKFEEAEMPMKDVWTSPLHEPISSVLGLAQNNGRGEFASAGWVIQSLLVSAPIARVPFVFFFVEDAKLDVPANVLPKYENPF